MEVLGGTTLSDAEVQAAIARGELYDGIALSEDCNLRIEPTDWPGIHGNHSCDPNLWMRDAVTIEARSDIFAGDELTIELRTRYRCRRMDHAMPLSELPLPRSCQAAAQRGEGDDQPGHPDDHIAHVIRGSLEGGERGLPCGQK